jgi:hypothetical protein
VYAEIEKDAHTFLGAEGNQVLAEQGEPAGFLVYLTLGGDWMPLMDQACRLNGPLLSRLHRTYHVVLSVVNEDQVRLNSAVADLEVPREVRIVADDPNPVPLPMIETQGRAWALVWPGMGAHLRSFHRLSLRPDGRTIPLRHPMEAVYYVIAGTVEVHDLDVDARHQVITGGMILVDPGTRYRIAAGPGGSEVVGGPSPADPMLYSESGAD